VRVQISPAAHAFVSANGGQVWVWATRQRMCCAGAPALMRAATGEPGGISGFETVDVDVAGPGQSGVQVHFRPTAGRQPDVLEIGMTGRRHSEVAAYWDGCLMAMV
jgi:hypothetical protein